MLCLGRHTITGLLATCGQQFHDWSAAYRLFSQPRLDPAELFALLRCQLLSDLPPAAPLWVAMDDSLLPKSGPHIPGVAWRRDPLGPRFQANLIRAQRVVQWSIAVPTAQGPAAARLVPIDFLHAPTAVKPHPKAPPEQWAAFRQQQRQHGLSRQAALRLPQLQASLHAHSEQALRPLCLLVDGRFTNQEVFRRLPPGTVLIGRIRQDAKLFFLPSPGAPRARGRPARYGSLAPTPEQLRQDESIPWQSVRAVAAGAERQFRVKSVAGLLWRTAGAHRPLRLVVIAPLRYRPRRGSRLLYRRPAFLICTDDSLPLPQIVQSYVWRWEIEVNFRDEKSLLGVGQAQVRNPRSVESVPALVVAAYAMLLLAALRAAPAGALPNLLPPPKWSSPANGNRTSTQQLLHQLRAEVWARGLGLDHFSGFSSAPTPTQKGEKFLSSLPSAVLYCNA